MRKNQIFVLLAGLMMLSGCSYLQGQGERIQSVTVRTYDAPYEEVWTDIKQILHDQDELLAESSERDGYMVTEWVIRKSRWDKFFPGVGSKRYRYRVQLEDLGDQRSRISVRMDQDNYHGDGMWGPGLPSDERAKALISALDSRVTWNLSTDVNTE